MLDFITAGWLCYLLAPVIALAVQWLKGVEIIAAYPKLFAAIVSALVSVVSAWTFGGLEWAMIAECTLVQFAGAVATYEVAVKPLARAA